MMKYRKMYCNVVIVNDLKLLATNIKSEIQPTAATILLKRPHEPPVSSVQQSKRKRTDPPAVILPNVK